MRTVSGQPRRASVMLPTLVACPPNSNLSAAVAKSWYFRSTPVSEYRTDLSNVILKSSVTLLTPDSAPRTSLARVQSLLLLGLI